MVDIYYIMLLALKLICEYLELQAHGAVAFGQNMDSTCKLARNHICIPIKVNHVNNILCAHVLVKFNRYTNIIHGMHLRAKHADHDFLNESMMN
jgi:hypothetical protein